MSRVDYWVFELPTQALMSASDSEQVDCESNFEDTSVGYCKNVGVHLNAKRLGMFVFAVTL